MPAQGQLWIVPGVVALSTLIVAVPCIRGAFVPPRRVLLLALVRSVYCAALALAEFSILCLVLGAPGSHHGEIAATFSLVNITRCATVLASLLLLRLAGLRFVRVTVPKPLAKAGGKPTVG